MKFFVGDYTRLGGPGVALCELDGNAMRLIESSAELLENPTYVILSGDQNTLYATSSTPCDGEQGGSVAAYDVSAGTLRLVSRHSTAGFSACHLTLSPDERFLYVANYASGSIAVFPVSGTQIDRRIQLIQHQGHGPNVERQEQAHAHFVAFHPEDGCLYAVDLGMDAIMRYQQNPETGLLTLKEQISVPAGLGPRHLVFAPNDMMYVAHELGSAVSVFRRTEDRWQLTQTLSTLPPDWTGENTAAAIRRKGDLLAVSNRGHDSLACFLIQPDGSLCQEGIYSTLGRTPRDFVILPEGRILAAHQDSGDIRLLEHDEHGLHPVGDPLPLAGAVCVCPWH